MQAYASAARLFSEAELRTADRAAPGFPACENQSSPDIATLDGLLGRLADLVVDRLLERVCTPDDEHRRDWMDARAAADYLGIHPISASTATHCASWPPSVRCRCIRTDRDASSTSVATSSISGGGPAEPRAAS